MFGPPEKVWSDKVETTVPGLIFTEHGRGRVTYIPWDVGGLYYRHSSEAHRGLVADLVDRLLPAGRQVTTTAHPLVELTMMDQPARSRTLIHLVNGSGHHDTAYFPPLEIRELRELTRYRERLVREGSDPASTTPDAFAAYMRAEVAKWSKVIKDANIRVD